MKSRAKTLDPFIQRFKSPFSTKQLLFPRRRAVLPATATSVRAQHLAEQQQEQEQEQQQQQERDPAG